MPSTARYYAQQQTHYLRRNFTFAEGDGAVIVVGHIPAGSIVVGGGVHVDVAFDAGTLNTADVGYAAHGTVAADPNGLASALTLGSAGLKPLDEIGAATNRVFQEDTQITATLALTGTAATTGSGTILVEYIPNNDRR